jgi:hypothetical protein
MLIITLQNIGSTNKGMFMYDGHVRVNQLTIWRGKIGPHTRERGWKVLVSKLLRTVDEHPEWGDGK